ncbi:GNAT family N-acetyltransferase [Bosea sp. NPDC003192]|uniref:GNAT family N-acetyltransferase n=1 Tax=Bosea sp. NPDC003192 TaxID=3390551 RepID=UPI003D06FC98
MAACRSDGDRIVVTHTEVPPAFNGRGLGSQLAEGIFEIARASGRRVVPRCSFVAAWARGEGLSAREVELEAPTLGPLDDHGPAGSHMLRHRSSPQAPGGRDGAASSPIWKHSSRSSAAAIMPIGNGRAAANSPAVL